MALSPNGMRMEQKNPQPSTGTDYAKDPPLNGTVRDNRNSAYSTKKTNSMVFAPFGMTMAKKGSPFDLHIDNPCTQHNIQVPKSNSESSTKLFIKSLYERAFQSSFNSKLLEAQKLSQCAAFLSGKTDGWQMSMKEFIF